MCERQLKVNRQNIVGAQIRKLRYNRGWSQAQLAIQLQLKGLDVGREVVAQIEGQTHCVKDRDLPYFARVFQVGLTELFPDLQPDKPVHDTITRLLGRGRNGHGAQIVMKSLQPTPAKVVNGS
jgi:transcriptional regulator with XRE-family HTH domain